MKLKASFSLVLLLTASALLAGDTLPIEKCVINGDKFSEHKTPVTVTYKGKSMQVCCNGCARKFKRDPEKFLKLWDAAVKAKTAKK